MISFKLLGSSMKEFQELVERVKFLQVSRGRKRRHMIWLDLEDGQSLRKERSKLNEPLKEEEGAIPPHFSGTKERENLLLWFSLFASKIRARAAR